MSARHGHIVAGTELLSLVGEYVLIVPAQQVELGALGQETETSFRDVHATLPGQHHVQLVPQRVQVQHIGGGVGQLRLAEGLRRPVGGLLLLGEIDPQQFAHQILQTMPIRIGAAKFGGDLGAIHRPDLDAEGVGELGDVKTPEMEDLGHLGIAEQALQIGRACLPPRDLHHIRRTVAWRKLHHAEPVALEIEPQRLGVDGDAGGVARQVRQIALV